MIWRKVNGETDRQTDGQTGRRADGQTDRDREGSDKESKEEDVGGWGRRRIDAGVWARVGVPEVVRVEMPGWIRHTKVSVEMHCTYQGSKAKSALYEFFPKGHWSLCHNSGLPSLICSNSSNVASFDRIARDLSNECRIFCFDIL